MDADDTKCRPDAEEGSRPTKSEAGGWMSEARRADAERTIHRLHRLSPDPNPSIASPIVAPDDGLHDPDGLGTEAAERNIVAKTMMLRPCSTDSVLGFEISCARRGGSL